MVAVRRAGGRFLAREIIKAGGGGGSVSRALAAAALEMDAPETAGREPPPPAASAMAARMTPAVLFVTVVLAVVLLVSGLLHVLRRLFLKSHHGGAERQLQQLFFPPHEDGAGGGGLGQDAIDALPEFAYGELSGAAAGRAAGKGKAKQRAADSRPFDCAVCLCEFADDDRLRLLPLCGHAFHVACIDVWFRSSTTCPLCRAALRGLAAAADTSSVEAPDVEEQKQQQEEEAPNEAAASSVVLPVRLGRFKNVAGEASTSASPRLDGRRCYSMGSHQYVLADEHLLVSVHLRHSNAGGSVAGTSAAGVPAARSSDGDQRGKKVCARGDSFSVSKIWQWRGGDRRLPPSLRAPADDDLPPWAPPSPSACTRQQSDT